MYISHLVIYIVLSLSSIIWITTYLLCEIAGCRPYRELKWWVEVDVFTGPSESVFFFKLGPKKKVRLDPKIRSNLKQTGRVWPH
jgi:hypothetical protein